MQLYFYFLCLPLSIMHGSLISTFLLRVLIFLVSFLIEVVNNREVDLTIRIEGEHMVITKKSEKLGFKVIDPGSKPPLFVFSRKVKEHKIDSDKITRQTDIKRLMSIIEKLSEHGKEKYLEEVELEENCENWISRIFDSYNVDDNELIELTTYLLRSFTGSMKTRMREKDRYAVAIVSQNLILLTHSVFGERTVTPDWKIIPRMMDKDNVLRYVFFKKVKGKIKVRYFESYHTESFSNWLGLSQGDFYYLHGGKNKIYTEILGNSAILEFTDDEIENISGMIKGNRIILDDPIKSINISQVRMDKKRYDTFNDFIQEYTAERYNLNYYSRTFNSILNSLDTLMYRYFDYKEAVEKVQGDDSSIVIKKSNPNFNILFGTEKPKIKIEFRNDYLDELFSKYLNNDTFRVYHAGDKMDTQGLVIGPMKIYNKLFTNFSGHVISFLTDKDLKDKNLFYMLSFVVFKLLTKENSDKYICSFLNEFSKKFIEMIELSPIVTKENSVLEFKGAEYFLGTNKKIVDQLSSDITTKLKDNNEKIYLIGIDEHPDGTFNPIPLNKLKSDRLSKIEETIKNKCEIDYINILSIPIDEKNGIVCCIISNNSND